MKAFCLDIFRILTLKICIYTILVGPKEKAFVTLQEDVGDDEMRTEVS